jgi:hypothetical protein
MRGPTRPNALVIVYPLAFKPLFGLLIPLALPAGSQGRARCW